MKRIAKFHKVSFEQFAKDWKDTFEQYSEEEIRRELRPEVQDMIFMHLWM